MDIFHTKCKLKDFDIDNYLFGYKQDALTEYEMESITDRLRKEMDEIFYGKNLTFNGE